MTTNHQIGFTELYEGGRCGHNERLVMQFTDIGFRMVCPKFNKVCREYEG